MFSTNAVRADRQHRHQICRPRTPTNNAIQKYLGAKKVPQLFVATGATKFGDPKNFPWTMGWQPTYQTEGRIYAKYILQNLPQGKIGVLYQNDDSGRDYLKGLRDGLGAEAAKRMIIAEIPNDPTEPTVDSQVGCAKDLRRRYLLRRDLAQVRGTGNPQSRRDWLEADAVSRQHLQFRRLRPEAGGLENSKGVLSSNYIKDPTDPTWKDDPAIKEWSAFMDKYFPEGDNVYGYATAQTLVQVLRQCGDDLTRENIMRQAASLKNFQLGLLLPGIKINTSPTDYFPIEQMQMSRFNGQHGELFGSAISGEIGRE